MSAELYLIATRRYAKDGRHYRTRYYFETRDARPRFVKKQDARRFTLIDAQAIARQLRQMQLAAFVLEESKRPQRVRRGARAEELVCIPPIQESSPLSMP